MTLASFEANPGNFSYYVKKKAMMLVIKGVKFKQDNGRISI
jgi:hypothetical protein